MSLEHLLDQVKQALLPFGRLLISDMIGRNGHQRWPSALHSIWQHWSTLPPSYRFNNAFDSYEELYVDRDYSSVGFEGIGAEDILPQLLSRFDVEFFFGFGNLIDPASIASTPPTKPRQGPRQRSLRPQRAQPVTLRRPRHLLPGNPPRPKTPRQIRNQIKWRLRLLTTNPKTVKI